MKFTEWLKGKEEKKSTTTIVGAKVTYSDVRKAVHLCEWDRKSKECKEALQKLGVEDYAPEFERGDEAQ